MPERPDLRKIAASISEALEGFEREALAEILTYVFKEYVVEGVPPQLMGRADTIEDLAALSFPEIISALQTRLDVPELGLFQVQQDVVLVRAGGVLTPLTVDDVVQRAPLPEPAPSLPTETQPAPSRSTVDEARARGRGDLAGFDREAIRAPAPRPRGISINGRPPRGPATAAETAAPEPAPQSPPPPSAPPADASAGEQAGDGKPREGEDSSSIRFSLLELD